MCSCCRYYYINYTTIELFSRSLTARTKIKHLLEILSAAKEFTTIPVRHKEDNVLRRLAERCPIKLPKGARFNDPATKVELLLQAHFSRYTLSVRCSRTLPELLSLARGVSVSKPHIFRVDRRWLNHRLIATCAGE